MCVVLRHISHFIFFHNTYLFYRNGFIPGFTANSTLVTTPELRYILKGISLHALRNSESYVKWGLRRDEIKQTRDTEAGALACTIRLCEGEQCTCPAVLQSPHCSSSLTCPWVKGPSDRPDLPWIPAPRLGWPSLSGPVTSPIIPPEQHLSANAFVPHCTLTVTRKVAA